MKFLSEAISLQFKNPTIWSWLAICSLVNFVQVCYSKGLIDIRFFLSTCPGYNLFYGQVSFHYFLEFHLFLRLSQFVVTGIFLFELPGESSVAFLNIFTYTKCIHDATVQDCKVTGGFVQSWLSLHGPRLCGVSSVQESDLIWWLGVVLIVLEQYRGRCKLTGSCCTAILAATILWIARWGELLMRCDHGAARLHNVLVDSGTAVQQVHLVTPFAKILLQILTEGSLVHR